MFLRFVRASNIRAVMYTYSYYGEQDLAEMFQLEDNDRSLFAAVSGKPTAYDMYGASRNKTKVYKGTDYSSYLRYSKFVQENVDLGHPRELRLYPAKIPTNRKTCRDFVFMYIYAVFSLFHSLFNSNSASNSCTNHRVVALSLTLNLGVTAFDWLFL